MLRIDDGVVRPGWENTIQAQGLTYWPTELPNGQVKSYWREGQFYVFSSEEIEQMYQDSRTIFEMLVAAGDYLLDHPKEMIRMGIPEWTHDQIRKSWLRKRLGEDFGSVYGRYDVVYGGNSLLCPHPDQGDTYDPGLARIRLFEFNADTPTGLPEAAVCQWGYHEDTDQGADQWNSIFEDLTAAWARNMAHIVEELGHKPIVYFVCDRADESGEDMKNLECQQKACAAAGFETMAFYIDEIYLDPDDGRFYHGEGGPHIDVVFKLYPWEMMVREEFGRAAFADMDRFGERASDGTYTGGTLWIEPPYKMLWSNKGILPILWKLFGEDPEKSQLLLPAYFMGDKPASMTSYVKKPIFGREGANVTIVVDGETVVDTDGMYGVEGFIVQERAIIPCYPGTAYNGETESNYPVLGIWMVDGEPSGLGIRESTTEVTDNLSCFAPHLIADAVAA